ncbi:uncharacterized protein LOC142176406 [Nicotiana tabacum]|uniref:Uncharacterized protein LOC142176406 n=1 Tax=Nicotiana tabacum TaxID=4097 RepID=A0AC58TSB5_TOBAC
MAQNHPGFQWSNPNGAENPQRFFNQKQQVQGPPSFQNQNKGQQSFQQYQQQPQRAHQQSLEVLTYIFIKATDEKVESQHSAIKNLEIQVSQLATLMSGQIQGALPSNTEKNPKEHLKAISLRSGKSLDDLYADREGKPQEVEKVNEGENKKFPKEQKNKGKNVQENELITNPHSVPLPFPQKMKREKLDKQFSKFLDILKQLYINIPFTDALTQMPSYAKFLKEILSSKRKLEKVSVVKLIEKCSAILQNKLPQKLGDPGSFIIPCTVGCTHFEKALWNSGASINLIPFSIFRKLELGEMKDTSVSLQLADQSTKRSKGIIENILVRVDKFVFPVDFIVLEMEENNEKMMKFPGDESSSSSFQINLLDDLVDEYKDNKLIIASLERCLARSVIISSSLTIEQESKLIGVLRKHKTTLGWTIADIKGISPTICVHRILMENDYKPIVQPQRRLNPAMQEVVKKEVVKLLATSIIYPISDSLWIPIALEDQEKTTFTCPQGTYAYRRMPFGLCNAPATFQHCISAIFSDMTEKFLEIFMYDFTLFGKTFEDCLYHLTPGLKKCEETNLILNWEKYHFMVTEGIVLGHKISAKGIEVDKAKIDLIAGLPPPTTVKGIRSFLGHAGFYRRVIKDFSKISKPLTNLLMKDVKFEFSDDCRKAFKILKEHLTNAPIVISPDWSEPFEIMCDASDIAVRAILEQKRDKIFRPIYYASRTLNEAQKNYATTEKELLAVVFAFDKFRSYLLGTMVTIYTDHAAL